MRAPAPCAPHYALPAAGASLAWTAANVAALAGALGHLDFGSDPAAATKTLLDLLLSGPSLAEVGKSEQYVVLGTALLGLGSFGRLVRQVSARVAQNAFLATALCHGRRQMLGFVGLDGPHVAHASKCSSCDVLLSCDPYHTAGGSGSYAPGGAGRAGGRWR